MKAGDAKKGSSKKGSVVLQEEGNKYILNISKDAISRKELIRLLQKLELAALSQTVRLKKDAASVFENFQERWWKTNKGKFLSSEK